jgi:aminoglycoside phosphotransferase (APT) family kinase protein
VQWDAERSVDIAQARALIARRFPELRGAPVAAAGAGWDNTVYRVRDDLVFRFPRRAVALDGIRREIAHLPRLAPDLPLPIPVPVYIGGVGGADNTGTAGEPGDDFDWPFWGGPYIPGRELALSGLDDAGRVAAAASLGAFLRVLHDPARVPAHAALPVDPMARATPSSRVVKIREWLGALGVSEPSFLRQSERLGPPLGSPVVVHGDLHIRHLLVGEDGRAAGVIDWGDLALGDPAVDLSIGFAAFAGAARVAFFDAYGRVDGEREVRARVLALSLCAALGAQATDSLVRDGRADRGELEAVRVEALAGLGRAMS